MVSARTHQGALPSHRLRSQRPSDVIIINTVHMRTGTVGRVCKVHATAFLQLRNTSPDRTDYERHVLKTTPGKGPTVRKSFFVFANTSFVS